MTIPAPLPSLFGRFTAILQDHEHLGTTLRRLRTMCAALDASAPKLPPELSPSVLLSALQLELKQHFAAEESPAYFGTLADEAPSLEARITALEGEHLAMLTAIEDLLDVARERERWTVLAVRTRELIAELERHERSESQLLRLVFSGQS